jgi:hypothetical protein
MSMPSGTNAAEYAMNAPKTSDSAQYGWMLSVPDDGLAGAACIRTIRFLF